jgi:hypothetical protein
MFISAIIPHSEFFATGRRRSDGVGREQARITTGSLASSLKAEDLLQWPVLIISIKLYRRRSPSPARGEGFSLPSLDGRGQGEGAAGASLNARSMIPKLGYRTSGECP